MFPQQPIWSNTRVDLLQRCSRAFVLRYGVAQLSQNHPKGQALSEIFQIQTPWILLHQTIRETVLEYVEDYANGTIWSTGLLSAKFKHGFTQLIRKRNQLIKGIMETGLISQPGFQCTQVEAHLVEMGTKLCIGLIHHPEFVRILEVGTIKRLEPTDSIHQQNVRIYNAPDMMHFNNDQQFLVKIHPFQQRPKTELELQASLLQLYGDEKTTIVFFHLNKRAWSCRKIVPNPTQKNQAIGIVEQDIKHMMNAFYSVGKHNDLSKVPLADSYRSCMHCNVQSLCPTRHGYERAKAEQRALMCQKGTSVVEYI